MISLEILGYTHTHGFIFVHLRFALCPPVSNERQFFLGFRVFLFVCFFLLSPKSSTNEPEGKNYRHNTCVTATVYLETSYRMSTRGYNPLQECWHTMRPHRKQLIGECVYAFIDLQLVYIPSCSRNNNFIIYNGKLKWKELLYILAYSISFDLPSKYWDQAGTPDLQAPSESTWALPPNIGLPWSMGLSNTAKEKGQSTREEDSLQFTALHRTAGLKTLVSRRSGKFDLT